MSLIVEDGTGKSDSEAYISVADADAYHSARNNSDWDLLDDPQKEAKLRIATEYMVAEYRNRWKGYRSKVDQALDWPRQGVVIENGRVLIKNNTIPTEIKRACAELALRASMGALIEDQTQKVASETVGPITVVYDRFAPAQPQYRQVDLMLKPYLDGGGPMLKLERR